MLGAFAVEFVYPTPFARIAVAFVLLVFALNLLAAHRRELRPLLRAALPGQRAGRHGP